jgi:hypothetical protein
VSTVVRPATKARFGDVAAMLGPKNPESSVCWCLSHRLDWKTNRELTGPARGEYVRKLCSRDPEIESHYGIGYERARLFPAERPPWSS